MKLGQTLNLGADEIWRQEDRFGSESGFEFGRARIWEGSNLEVDEIWMELGQKLDEICLKFIPNSIQLKFPQIFNHIQNLSRLRLCPATSIWPPPNSSSTQIMSELCPLQIVSDHSQIQSTPLFGSTMSEPTYPKGYITF